MNSDTAVLESPAPNGLSLASIRPSVASKFSPNLHRWLSSRSDMVRYAKVYRSKDGSLMIGYLDGADFIGAMLMLVLCYGSKREAQSLCYSAKELELVEFEQFWLEYAQLGRCAIDPEHIQAFTGERFSQDGDARTCLWCGKQQTRIRTISQVVCERWA